MALNESINPAMTRRFPCPTAITSGMPVLIGTLAAVAETAYDSKDGSASFMFDGAHQLNINANSTQSPVSGQTVQPGDELFALGTYDAVTNMTYNLVIDKTRGGVPFGNYWGTTNIAAGLTAQSALVRLKLGGSGAYAP